MKKAFTIFFISLVFSGFAQVRKLQAEPNHSTVGFSLPIAGFTKITGKFSDYTIRLDWNDEDYTSSTISASIKVASINTGIKDRDDHLRTADFFDVDQYPEITFSTDSIRSVGFSNFEAFGELSMHGITKSFVLPFQIIKMDGNTIGFKSRTVLNRIEFGVGTEFKHTSMPNFLAKNVEVEIDFWTKKRKD